MNYIGGMDIGPHKTSFVILEVLDIVDGCAKFNTVIKEECYDLKEAFLKINRWTVDNDERAKIKPLMIAVPDLHFDELKQVQRLIDCEDFTIVPVPGNTQILEVLIRDAIGDNLNEFIEMELTRTEERLTSLGAFNIRIKHSFHALLYAVYLYYKTMDFLKQVVRVD